MKYIPAVLPAYSPELSPRAIPPLTPEQIGKITERLTELGVAAECPRCSNVGYAIVPYLFKPPVQSVDAAHHQLSVNIPLIATTCLRCGFLSQYALGTLGFMEADGNIKL